MEFMFINIQGCNIVRALVLVTGLSLSKPHIDKFALTEQPCVVTKLACASDHHIP